MKDIVFASDLDNTLLYSRSHKREGDICVEHIAGRAHGFMTPLTVERLREVSQKLCLIPVTTRSIEQYKRIDERRNAPARRRGRRGVARGA